MCLSNYMILFEYRTTILNSTIMSVVFGIYMYFRDDPIAFPSTHLNSSHILEVWEINDKMSP